MSNGIHRSNGGGQADQIGGNNRIEGDGNADAGSQGNRRVGRARAFFNRLGIGRRRASTASGRSDASSVETVPRANTTQTPITTPAQRPALTRQPAERLTNQPDRRVAMPQRTLRANPGPIEQALDQFPPPRRRTAYVPPAPLQDFARAQVGERWPEIYVPAGAQRGNNPLLPTNYMPRNQPEQAGIHVIPPSPDDSTRAPIASERDQLEQTRESLSTFSLVPVVDGEPATEFPIGPRESSSIIALDSMPRARDESSWSATRNSRWERQISEGDLAPPLPPPIRESSVIALGTTIDDDSAGDEPTYFEAEDPDSIFARQLAEGVPQEFNYATGAAVNRTDLSAYNRAINALLDEFEFLNTNQEQKTEIARNISNYLQQQQVNPSVRGFDLTVTQAVYAYLFDVQVRALNLGLEDADIDSLLIQLTTNPDIELGSLIDDRVALQDQVVSLRLDQALDQLLDQLPQLQQNPIAQADVKRNVLENIRREGLGSDLINDEQALSTVVLSYLIEVEIKVLYPTLPMSETNRVIADLVNRHQADGASGLTGIAGSEETLIETITDLRAEHAVTDALDGYAYQFPSTQAKSTFINTTKGALTERMHADLQTNDRSSIQSFVGAKLIEAHVQTLGLNVSDAEASGLVIQLLGETNMTVSELLNDRDTLTDKLRSLQQLPRLQAELVAINFDHSDIVPDVSTALITLRETYTAETLQGWLATPGSGELVEALAVDKLESVVGQELANRAMTMSPADMIARIKTSTPLNSQSLLADRELIQTEIAKEQLGQMITDRLMDSRVTTDQRAAIISRIIGDQRSINELDKLINDPDLLRFDINQAITQVRRDSQLERASGVIQSLGLSLSDNELDNVMMSLRMSTRPIGEYIADRRAMLDFARSVLPSTLTYSLGQPRVNVPEGREFETASRLFARNPDVVNPRITYQSADGQRAQAGIDEGGLTRQFWGNMFEQMEEKAVMRKQDDGTLSIKASREPIPAQDLVDARQSGQIVAAALSNRTHHNTTFLQEFEPRVHAALNQLNFEATMPERHYATNGIIRTLCSECLNESETTPDILATDLENLSSDNEVHNRIARELVQFVYRFTPDLDNRNRMTETQDNGDPIRSVDKVKNLIADLKLFGIMEDDSRLIDLLKDEVQPLVNFVSGFNDVYSVRPAMMFAPRRTQPVGEQVRQMMGGKTVFEYLNPTAEDLRIETPAMRALRTNYVQIEIADSACTALGVSPYSDRVGNIENDIKAMMVRYINEECTNASADSKKRARALIKFITGAQSADPRAPIKLKIVRENTVERIRNESGRRVTRYEPTNQPKPHTCFNEVDIPVAMLRDTTARGQTLDYAHFRNILNAVVDDDGFGAG